MFPLDRFTQLPLSGKSSSVIFLNATSYAADVTVEMLNKQGKESMVYSQKIVKINVGDKVFWKASSKGHNVAFINGGVPEGVEKFKSKYDYLEQKDRFSQPLPDL